MFNYYNTILPGDRIPENMGVAPTIFDISLIMRMP